MKVAQHFSAGSRALNYSKAREAGDRFRKKPISVVRFADLIVETLPDPSTKVLGYSHRVRCADGRKYLAKVRSRQTSGHLQFVSAGLLRSKPAAVLAAAEEDRKST